MNVDAAFDLEVRVLAARAIERRTWVTLAAQLTAFHKAKAWQTLGWERFTDWLGTPEVGLGRRHAYRLMQAWNWGCDAEVPLEALERLDLSKLAVVLPALRKGSVSAQDALSDVETLSRSDLLTKYGSGAHNTREKKSTETCPECGCEREKAACEQDHTTSSITSATGGGGSIDADTSAA